MESVVGRVQGTRSPQAERWRKEKGRPPMLKAGGQVRGKSGKSPSSQRTRRASTGHVPTARMDRPWRTFLNIPDGTHPEVPAEMGGGR